VSAEFSEQARAVAKGVLDDTVDANLLVAGKYLLEEEVGRGGMGRVWRAIQVGLKRRVALKFLESPADPLARERFLREAQALAKCSHDGVMRVIEFGFADDEPFLATEWIEGQSLSTLIEARTPQSATRIATWGCEIAAAAFHAHARGVLHRDIKPSNVMQGTNGKLILIDFGIARSLPGSAGGLPTLTESALVAGTPGFVAPELFSGAAPEIRHDVYSLGGTLLALCALVPEDDPNRARLVSTLKRAIAVEPNERPDTMDAFREALRALSHPGTQLEAPSPPADASNVPIASERAWISAVALLFTLTAALGIWSVVLGLTPKIVSPGELSPLTHWLTEPMPDGRLLSRVRFEIAPTLVFVLACSASLAALGVLRAQWARVPAPKALQIDGIRTLLWLGVIILCTFIGRHLLAPWHTSPAVRVYVHMVPLIGGLLEVFALFLLFQNTLVALRLQPAQRAKNWQWKLGLGMTLALIPPSATFLEGVFR
jgi:eukaryotic-like serine/threonine-protein kinase